MLLLPSLLLPLLVLASCALFAVGTWQVADDGPLLGLDERLSEAMRHAAPPRAVSEVLADLGNIPVAVPVFAVALVCTVAAGRLRGPRAPRGWLLPVCATLALAAVPVLVVPLKELLARPGPPGGTNYYPSGHAATTSVAFGGALLLVTSLPPGVLRRWLRTALTVVVAAAVVGNGLGLVWRGYHWPLDVLASWCLGGVLLAAARTAARAGAVRLRAGPRGGAASAGGDADGA